MINVSANTLVSATFDLLPPQLSALAVSPRAFRTVGKGPTGTKVHFKLSVPATVRFTIQRSLDGRQAGGGCVAPTTKNQSKRRCTRWVSMGSFSVAGRAGVNDSRFSGRLNGSKLPVATYKLTGTPNANGHAGNAQIVTFQVRR
jgi:hypothetical protein